MRNHRITKLWIVLALLLSTSAAHAQNELLSSDQSGVGISGGALSAGETGGFGIISFGIGLSDKFEIGASSPIGLEDGVATFRIGFSTTTPREMSAASVSLHAIGGESFGFGGSVYMRCFPRSKFMLAPILGFSYLIGDSDANSSARDFSSYTAGLMCAVKLSHEFILILTPQVMTVSSFGSEFTAVGATLGILMVTSDSQAEHSEL